MINISLLLLFLFVCTVHCERVILTCDHIRAFVDGHNTRRLKVAQGLVPGQPAASNMQFMVWDKELAEKASDWADKGVFAHNPDKTIGSKRWNSIGENIYMSNFYSNMGDEAPINIEEALDFWFQEYKNYNFCPFYLNFVNQFAHYTQMVWSTTNRIGCGISQTKDNNFTKTLFVCDYGPTGNYFEQKPYNSTQQATNILRCSDGACSKPYGSNC
ncbi:unnamed protein product [Parnassius mnemosyne]|uniref:SCP domain-containing protein n=1 Tax=Parnassius mnemosyne TaxID=213953 RepID=A0AAV1LTH2_9NEOP